ncbi:PD-(D/E)XK nuclease family protein [Cytophagaceae bacterium ABcell3]|nr:PD-(D/E)XK nuclease family protein [Cytophagaceae bacterium ABcell3]
MKKKFLQIVAEQTWDKSASDYCYVFPSRRAGVYFRDHLKAFIRARGEDGVVMMPQVATFSEFVKAQSPYLSADPLDLSVRMYRIYCSLVKEGTAMDFDRFYPLSVTMLRDFNEMDFALADIDQLFSDMSLLKEYEFSDMESLFSYEGVKQFFQAFRSYGNNKIREQYLWLWKLASDLYKNLKAEVISEGLAWDGLNYRMLSEGKIAVPGKKAIFAGFNALNKSEAAIVEKLLVGKQAAIFWDGDDYYVNNPMQEAGMFIRKYAKRWEAYESIVVSAGLQSDKKNIYTYGNALQAGQVKALHYVLNQLLDEGLNPAETMVVLPDQNMLQPLLFSLPERLENINVTMGINLRRSHLLTLYEYLYQTYREGKQEEAAFLVSINNLTRILRHPLIYPLASGAIERFTEALNTQNLLLASHENLKLVAESCKTLPALQQLLDLIFSYDRRKGKAFFQLLIQMNRYLQKAPMAMSAIDKESLVFANAVLDKIISNAYLKTEAFSLSFHTAWKLLREVFASATLPLEGNASGSLQVMGPMETRCLDFKNIFILSANEGIYPAKPSSDTLLPYQVRKAYGLPDYETHDANYSYQFYNLIQRAENVYCFYNTEASGAGKGEISRYFQQLKYELSGQKGAFDFSSRIFSFDLGKSVEPKPISIPKDANVLREILNYTEGSGKGFYLSPSALSVYLNCPLQFYFTYIKKVKVPEEGTEDLEAWAMGNIVHRTMELLYEAHVESGQPVTASDIKELQKKANAVMDKVLDEEMISQYRRKGFNNLLLAALRKYVLNILLNDLESVPFKVLSSEEKIRTGIKVGGHVFELGGKIDQVRERAGEVCLVDYKTGKSQKEPVKLLAEPELYVEEVIGNQQKFRYIFQMAMYGWLYQNVKSVPFPSLQLHFLRDNHILQLQYPSGSDPCWFGDKLAEKLQELSDADVPFLQTEDEKSCTYCAFKKICQR